MLFRSKIRFEHIFAAVLCVYGLGLYHYFIHRSGVTSYYAVCVPLVLVICFWLSKPLGQTPGLLRSEVILAMSVLFALLTSYLFTFYPNVLNLVGMDWKPEREFYQKEFNLADDADLVRRFTAPQERVALISSFETKILIQAGRAPFFYYSPLIESAHMASDEFRGTYLHTQARLDKTMGQLQERRPPYIFVERKLIKGALSQKYQNDHPTLKTLLDYVNAHYEAQAEGRYLTAYRRNN